MPPLLRALVFLTAVCVPALLSAQAPIQTSLLVLSKRDHALAIVNPLNLVVTARVPVGNDPHEVIASSDGSTAYVSNYGFGAYHTLAVVDLVTDRALPSVDLGPLTGPHGLTFVGGKTWFTAEGAKAIGRYDPMQKKVDWVLGTGQNRTHMIYVSPDQHHILTTNVSSGTLSMIDWVERPMPPPPRMHGTPPPGGHGGPPGPRMDWNETVVRVGDGSEGFDVSPDGKQVWVANAHDGTISVVDRASERVVATLHADVPGANRLKFTPDGRRVLVSLLGSGSGLVVLDAHTRKVVARVPVGHGGAGILIQPDGKRAYISCSQDNYVAVLDLASMRVVGHIKAGDEPDGLAWAVRR